jgi:hypothetical protein
VGVQAIDFDCVPVCCSILSACLDFAVHFSLDSEIVLETFPLDQCRQGDFCFVDRKEFAEIRSAVFFARATALSLGPWFFGSKDRYTP